MILMSAMKPTVIMFFLIASQAIISKTEATESEEKPILFKRVYPTVLPSDRIALKIIECIENDHERPRTEPLLDQREEDSRRITMFLKLLLASRPRFG